MSPAENIVFKYKNHVAYFFKLETSDQEAILALLTIKVKLENEREFR